LIEAFVEDGAKHASHKLGFLTAKTFFIFLSLYLVNILYQNFLKKSMADLLSLTVLKKWKDSIFHSRPKFFRKIPLKFWHDKDF
jgi:hypothetical protein